MEAIAPSLITRHSLAEERLTNRPLILVVEDNIVNQTVAVRMLEKLGCRIDVVANGLEAIEALSRVVYAAVFMDCQMPEMDGFEATKRIRETEASGGVSNIKSESKAISSKHETRSHVPIIAMTANAMQGDREQCLAAGMDGYISKPITSAEIQNVLARWIPDLGTGDTRSSDPPEDSAPPGKADAAA